MSAILSIGNHSWAIPSAAVAMAIHEVLTTCPRLVCTGSNGGAAWWRTAADDGPSVDIRPMTDQTVIGGEALMASTALSQVTQVVLGEPEKSRRRTHRILTAESRRLALESRRRQ